MDNLFKAEILYMICGMGSKPERSILKELLYVG
jgi:hypothetical protein